MSNAVASSAITCPAPRPPGAATSGRTSPLLTQQNQPGPIRKILTHLGEPLELTPITPARGPPSDWGEFVQINDDRDVFQASPDELPVIDIRSL